MKTIAITNQKGGCGKTTTAVNLAAALALKGYRTLIVDLDPQAHATLGFDLEPESMDKTVYEVLTDSNVMLSRIVDIPTIYAHVAISGVYALVYAGYLLVNARAYERIVLPS